MPLLESPPDLTTDILRSISQMVQSGEHCDVALKCHNGDVHVPGLILAAISPLFRTLGVYLSAEVDVNILLPDFQVDDMTKFIEQILKPQPLLPNDPYKQQFEDILQLFQKDFLAPFDCSLAKQYNHDDNDDDDEEEKEDLFDVDLDLFDKKLDLLSHQAGESKPAVKVEDDIFNHNNQDEETTEENQFDEDYDDADDDSFSGEDYPIVQQHKRAKKAKPTKLSAEARKTFDEDLNLYVCPHCSLQLKAGMTNHLKWHKEHPNEKYPSRSTCEHCGKTFKKIGILRAHIVRMHSNLPKKFKCAYEGCDRAFKMRGELNTHYLIHTDAKNFICTECGLGFRTKMAMDSHTLRKHRNLKPSIPCEECGKLFKVRSDLYSHAMTHKARKERVHRCDECNLTFRTDKSLARHRELHDPTRPLACSKCPLRYKNKDQLVRHVQTHEKPDIECKLCHRVFGRPDHLKRHIATKHASLSVVEQMHLSEALNKNKPRPAKQTHHHSKQDENAGERNSSLSTMSGADIVTLHPSPTVAFQPTSMPPGPGPAAIQLSGPTSQFRPQLDYSQMFQLTMVQQPPQQPPQ